MSNIKKKLYKSFARIIYTCLPTKIFQDKQFFSLWEKKGFHILPVHYYSPIPELSSIKDAYRKQSKLIGLNINEEGQMNLLSKFELFKSEYDQFPLEKPQNSTTYYVHNGMLESIDAEVLYCMVRHYMPKRIIEVGSGYSTLLFDQAISQNKQIDPDYSCELIAIEPYPNSFLKKGLPNLFRLIQEPVQKIPLSFFECLTEDDILFIDSSHALKTGGDVQFLYLEVLPRLKKGVIVHCHDIFLPAEYPIEWSTEECRFWTEQYLLQAFLAFNESFQILWAGQLMHLSHSELLKRAFNSYNKAHGDSPGSFWFQRIK